MKQPEYDVGLIIAGKDDIEGKKTAVVYCDTRLTVEGAVISEACYFRRFNNEGKNVVGSRINLVYRER